MPWEPELFKSHIACKNVLFPYSPSGLYGTDFKEPRGSSLAVTEPQKCVCEKAGEGRRRGEGRRTPAQGGAALHPGEAQLERALFRSHIAHLWPCTTTLRSVQSCWTSPAYICSHCRLPSSWDVTAASGISFPQRHAARTANGTRR